ncbi:MAG: hypothetical protein HYT30_02015 [Parcubacteria group bacterium]|nr:hypothetical protein [Parcubacteria group bacterium]
MFDMTRLSTTRSIVFILSVFAVWTILSIGWYVCGTNHMCDITATAETEVVVGLADTQAPVAVAFDRAGAAGEIFVMLMIAFTLGALLGRILAIPRDTDTESSASVAQESERSSPRTGAPVHISELTKAAIRTPIPMPIPQHTAAPVAISEKKEVSPTVIHLGGTAPTPHQPAVKQNAWNTPRTTAPIFPPKQATAPVLQIKQTPTLAMQPKPLSSDRPKIRFNTSWSKPAESKRS